MPSKLYLRGDSDALWLTLAADAVLSIIEDARAAGTGRFVRLDMAPFVRGEAARPAYFDFDVVSAILPVDPREWEDMLEDPPEWA